MSVENLYRPKGAGHSAPEEKRGYVEPRGFLVKAFEKWLDPISFLPEGYVDNDVRFPDAAFEAASRVLPKKLDIRQGEMDALLNAYSGRPEARQAGIFLGALYNKYMTWRIEYDADVPDIRRLCYGISHVPSIIVRGDTDSISGGQGMILNYGKAHLINEEATSHLVINFGECSSELASSSVAINFGKVGFMPNCSFAVNLGECEGSSEPWLFICEELLYRHDNCFDDTRVPWDKLNSHIRNYFEGLRERLSPDRPSEEVFAELEQIDVEKDLGIGSLRTH